MTYGYSKVVNILSSSLVFSFGLGGGSSSTFPFFEGDGGFFGFLSTTLGYYFFFYSSRKDFILFLLSLLRDRLNKLLVFNSYNFLNETDSIES